MSTLAMIGAFRPARPFSMCSYYVVYYIKVSAYS
jgi:hypothetical protein